MVTRKFHTLYKPVKNHYLGNPLTQLSPQLNYCKSFDKLLRIIDGGNHQKGEHCSLKIKITQKDVRDNGKTITFLLRFSSYLVQKASLCVKVCLFLYNLL